MNRIEIRRIYEEPSSDDGLRVLVDRLWPRGVSKESAQLDEWDKFLAPSPELRTWWNHDPDRMAEFAERYRTELDANDEAAAFADRATSLERLTLLYAARDPMVNHARILREWLLDR